MKENAAAPKQRKGNNSLALGEENVWRRAQFTNVKSGIKPQKF